MLLSRRIVTLPSLASASARIFIHRQFTASVVMSASSASTPAAARTPAAQPAAKKPQHQNNKPRAPKPAATSVSNGTVPVAASASSSSSGPAASASAPKPKNPNHNVRKTPNNNANAAGGGVQQPKKQQKNHNDESAASANTSPSLLVHPAFSSLHLIDIGANMLDDMFHGRYHGKKMHEEDLEQVLERAQQRGCKRIIVTAGCAKEGKQTIDLIESLRAKENAASRLPLLYSTVGVHPTRSKQWNGSEKHQADYFASLMASIERGVKTTPRTVVAIGECGLDYDRLHFSDKHSQLAHFEKHFLLVEQAKEKFNVNLPLFLHDRNTGGEFAAIMKKNRARFQHGVVHSFTGTLEDLKAHLALDLYIGINGCSLKTEDNLAVLHHIPMNRLLLETDAPWCDIKSTHASYALVPQGSKLESTRPEKFVLGTGVKSRNEPGNMIQVLEVVAAHLGVDPIELAEIVRKNTIEVFFPDELGAAAASSSASSSSSSSSSAAAPSSASQ